MDKLQVHANERTKPLSHIQTESVDGLLYLRKAWRKKTPFLYEQLPEGARSEAFDYAVKDAQLAQLQGFSASDEQPMEALLYTALRLYAAHLP